MTNSFNPVPDEINQLTDLLQVDVCLQLCTSDADANESLYAQSFLSNAAPKLLSNICWTNWFLTWLIHLRPTLSPINAYELTLRLTTNREIQQLNSYYRNRDQPTDVLAFATLDLQDDLLEDVYNNQPYYLGDIVISLETADIQAKESRHSLMYEIVWLAAHGLLHVLGWDHPDDDSLENMLTKQYSLLQLIDIKS